MKIGIHLPVELVAEYASNAVNFLMTKLRSRLKELQLDQ